MMMMILPQATNDGARLGGFTHASHHNDDDGGDEDVAQPKCTNRLGELHDRHTRRMGGLVWGKPEAALEFRHTSESTR